MGNLGGGLQNFTGPLSRILKIYFWIPQLEHIWLATLLGDFN